MSSKVGGTDVKAGLTNNTKPDYTTVVVDTKLTPTDTKSSLDPFGRSPAYSASASTTGLAVTDGQAVTPGQAVTDGQADKTPAGTDGQAVQTYQSEGGKADKTNQSEGGADKTNQGAQGQDSKTEVQGETTEEPKPQVQAKVVEPPPLVNWDEKKNKLRDIPPPIVKVLELPDFVKPSEEDPEFGKKTNKSLGFTYYAYLNALIFIIAAAYSLVAGFVILGIQYPIGLSSFLCFFIAFLFASAAVVQLVGFLNNKNKPVPHMVTTVVVNLIIFSTLLVAILQIVMENHLFAYAKETFKLRFARYAFRFIKEDIDKLFDSVALPYILIGIVALGAAACGILALVQCCYYIPMSWWNVVCCIILPVSVVILGLSVGIVFVCLSLFATPFSHTKGDDFSVFEVESPSGGYFQEAGIVLLASSGGLIIYVIVVFVSAKCYFSYRQKKKIDKGLGWPDSDKVTYEYFRKDDFAFPLSTIARNVLAACLGAVSLAIVLVVVLLLPTKDSDKFTVQEATDFLGKACTGFDASALILSQTLTIADTSFVSLSLSSSPSPSPSPSLPSNPPPPANTVEGLSTNTRAHTPTRTHTRFTLGYGERNPCADASESVQKFIKEYKNETVVPSVAAAEELSAMTEAARELVILSSILAISPLFPVLVVVVLLIAILLCTICCLPVVAVCIFGPKDTRTKIEKSVLEWREELEKGPITTEQNHTTMRQKKESIEERMTKFNNDLGEMIETREQLEKDVVDWSERATAYQSDKTLQTMELYTKMEKERKALETGFTKYNTKIEDYL